MQELTIEAGNPLLCFGQLYGMCDHVSYSLGNEGFTIYKSLPFGSIENTLMYLARRAHENRSVAQRTAFERKLIRNELKQRVKRKMFPSLG